MNRPKPHRAAIFVLIALFLPTLVSGQKQAEKAAKKPEQKPAKETLEASMTRSGVRYESANSRDPFFNILLTRKKTEVPDTEEARGQAPPGISGMYIAQVALLGISLGHGTQTAIFRGTDKRAYFLQEGDRLFDGFVKKIDPDSVMLVRETKMTSGKLLTQEIPKRLRTP